MAPKTFGDQPQTQLAHDASSPAVDGTEETAETQYSEFEASQLVEPTSSLNVAEAISLLHLGETLFRIREQRGYTQEQVAQILGIDASSISRMESGERIPKKEVVQRLAALYQISPDLLDLAFGRFQRAEHPGRRDRPAGQATRDCLLDQFTKVMVELARDVKEGRMSIDGAEKLVTAWEDAVAVAKQGPNGKNEARTQPLHTHTLGGCGHDAKQQGRRAQ